MYFRYFCLACIILSATSGYAQLSVSGRVESTAGEALPFVHVVNASQKVVVVSDVNGSFEVNASLDDTLSLSLVGFQPERIIVNDNHYQQLLRIVLVEDSVLLPGITIFERPIEPVVKLPEREFMTVTGVRGKEDIVQKPTIRFDMCSPSEAEGGVPTIGVGGTLTGVLTHLYERFSKDGKERRKYAESLKQSQEEAIFNSLIYAHETAEMIKQQYELKQPEYEKLIAAFNLEFPDAKKMSNQSEIWGLLHYFFSQHTSE